MASAGYARCLKRTTTTLQLDGDVLAAALVLARQRRRSLGDVISDLARQTLSRPLADGSQNEVAQLPLRASGAVVDLDLVNQLRDQEVLWRFVAPGSGLIPIGFGY